MLAYVCTTLKKQLLSVIYLRRAVINICNFNTCSTYTQEGPYILLIPTLLQLIVHYRINVRAQSRIESKILQNYFNIKMINASPCGKT